jgi:hypothetical protein
MTKPAIAIALLVGTASAVAAPQPAPSKKPIAPLKKPNFGEAFDLAPRHAALPGETTRAAKKLLTDQQVNTLVKSKLADVQYCWNRLPEAQRKIDATIVLKLAIEATGEVETVEIGGLASVEAQRCIQIAAAKWQFPVADQASETEYAIALRAM